MFSEADPAEEVIGGGLDYGIAAYHLRILSESGWNGGCGYTFEQIAEMTPDQVYFRLCDKGIFAGRPGSRTSRVTPASVAGKGGDGSALVRCDDGTVKRMGYGGKSKARRLMEAAAAQKATQPNTNRGRREKRQAEQRRARAERESSKHRDRRK